MSSWLERRPQSVLLVMGSVGIFRRNFTFFPWAAVTSTPSTRVCRSGGIAEGVGFDLEGSLVGGVLVFVDGVTHLPEIAAKFAFFGAFDLEAGDGNGS